MSRITEVVKLPSNGILYPIKEVTIQNMTVAEEKYLYGSYADTIDKILKSCVVDDIDLESLIVPDKYFILFKLRVLTYGKDYTVNVNCPYCSEENSKFKYTVDLSELEVAELSKDFKEPLTMTLPVSGDVIKYHVPRSSDITHAEEFARKKSSKFNIPYSDVLYVSRKMAGLDAVNDDDKMVEDELYKYVLDLSSKDSRYITHKFNQIEVGYNTQITCNCPTCGKEVNFRLPMSSDFFLAEFDD